MMTSVDDATFKAKVVRVKTLLIAVHFHSHWCKLCQLMQPFLNKLSAQVSSAELLFYACNVLYTPKFTQKYQISSVPNLVIFKNGKIIKTLQGLKPEAEIERFIYSLL